MAQETQQDIILHRWDALREVCSDMLKPTTGIVFENDDSFHKASAVIHQHMIPHRPFMGIKLAWVIPSAFVCLFDDLHPFQYSKGEVLWSEGIFYHAVLAGV